VNRNTRALVTLCGLCALSVAVGWAILIAIGWATVGDLLVATSVVAVLAAKAAAAMYAGWRLARHGEAARLDLALALRRAGERERWDRALALVKADMTRRLAADTEGMIDATREDKP
jgi:hypothetical protein